MLKSEQARGLNIKEYKKVILTPISKERVASYLERGLEENPNGYKCGNYIGGVKYNSKTGKLQKIFDASVGEAIHNSPNFCYGQISTFF